MPAIEPGPFCDNIAIVITGGVGGNFAASGTAGSTSLTPFPGATSWSATNISSGITLSNSNLTGTLTSNTSQNQFGIAVSGHTAGKYYYEATVNSLNGPAFVFGIASSAGSFATTFPGGAGTQNGIGFDFNGQCYFNGVNFTNIQTFSTGDTVCVAIDFGNTNAWFRTNGGNWNNSPTANPATNTGGLSFSGISANPYYPAADVYASSDKFTGNFGLVSYAFTPPAGFTNW